MDILSGLNPEQRAAVDHGEGPLLVVAGAGTGKTRVITHRIAHLIESDRAKPSQVLALTFTEKAAREMEERLYELIGWQSFQVPVMTFHAFGTELLGRFATHIGRSVRGGLLNETQKTLLLKQHINRVHLSYYGQQSDMYEFLDGVVAYIGSLQNEGVSAEGYESYVAHLSNDPAGMHLRDVDEQVDLAKLFRLYETVKAETGTFDYNDQLQIPLRILIERPNLAERLAQEYRYVLVDEYQDTNSTQDQLLRTFIGRDGNLFAVGDDDQAIYGFRGADIGNILSFSKHFDVREPAVLIRNYRSGQVILDAAYRLIRHNDPDRLETILGINKQMIGLSGESKAGCTPYLTPVDELQAVANHIVGKIKDGQQPASVAILASTHAPLKAMAKVLRNHGVGYALSTSVNIFEQPELLGLWHLLKWICMQADDETIGHVIMGPFLGWSPAMYRQILDESVERMESIEVTLRSSQIPEAHDLVINLDEWRKWSREVSVSQLSFKLTFETGLADLWREKAASSPRMVRVFEDLQRLLEQMQDFESVSVDPMLDEYSKTFPKPPDIEVSEPLGDTDGVQLLTVHASKGLEFDSVYVVGCTQRSWSAGRRPGRDIPSDLTRSQDLPPAHEFRRLMYVAATRAKKSLNVSWPTHSASGARMAVSPFVEELFGTQQVEVETAQETTDRLADSMNKLQRFYPLNNSAIGSARLPFESADGWLTLGVTQMQSYTFCPFEFYLQNVLQLKQPIGPSLAFGSTLHKIFENLYKSKLTGNDRPVYELHELLDELWSDRGYEQREIAESDRVLAHKTLDAVFGREATVQRRILASEMAVWFELPEAKLKLRGKIDAIFETEEGIELRDFKTGRSKTDSEKLSREAKDDFQLRTYALAYESMNGVAPSLVTLDYVVTGIEGNAKLTPAILRNHRSKLIEIASNIRSGNFEPNPSPMHKCSAIKYYGTGEQDELSDLLQMDRGITP
jgi:DNA helicase-2/ATP-dependent DNA helicase PcrA